MKQIKTDPDPFEQFAISQAIAVEPWIFVSGQAAIDSQGGVIGGNDFRLQADAAFNSLKTVLEAAESSLDDVVKVTIFVTDISRFSTVVELRQKYFSLPYPADSIVEVKALALPGLLFEIEAIAMRSAGRDKPVKT